MSNMPSELQAILSAPVKCTMSLIELMKHCPKLWECLTKKLVKQGVLNRRHFSQVSPSK